MKKFKPTKTHAGGHLITGEIKATLVGGIYDGMKRYSSDPALVECEDRGKCAALYRSNGTQLEDGSEEFVYVKTVTPFTDLYSNGKLFRGRRIADFRDAL